MDSRSQSSYDYKYSRMFFDYISVGSARSASVIVPKVIETLRISSILDVGCGVGSWLAEYLKSGVADALGVDGDYVSGETLLIPRAHFQVQNITENFDLKRKFHLAQCLEVAEHIHRNGSEVLVSNLTRHSSKILFSAAPPGQGGEHHINEQPYEFWRGLFAREKYVPFDFIRPAIRGITGVEPWYRYNTILYVHSDAIPTLHQRVVETHIPDGQWIPDYSPFSYQCRKFVLSRFSPITTSRLAIIKHRVKLALYRPKRTK